MQQSLQQLIGNLRLAQVHITQHVADLIRRIGVQRIGLAALAHILQITREGGPQCLGGQHALRTGGVQCDRYAGWIAIAQVGRGGNEVDALPRHRRPDRGVQRVVEQRVLFARPTGGFMVAQRLGQPRAVVPALQSPVVIPVAVGGRRISLMADRRRKDARESLRRRLVGLVAGHQRALAQFLQEAQRRFHFRQIGTYRLGPAIEARDIGHQRHVLALAVVLDVRTKTGVDTAIVVEDRRDQAVGMHAVFAVPGQVIARDAGFAHAQQHRRGGHAVADERAVVVAGPGLHSRAGLVDQHVGGLRAQHVHQRRIGQAQADLAQPCLPVRGRLRGQ